MGSRTMAVKKQVLLSTAVLAGMGVLPLGLGSNGAGKSSLLAELTAAIPPAAGAIRFDGRPLAGRRPHEVTHLGIALVPEGRRVYKDMSVAENLEMGAFPKRARGRLMETLDHVVQLFPILGQRRDQPAGTLSGGEQQMFAIGRALMSQGRFLLVDELLRSDSPP